MTQAVPPIDPNHRPSRRRATRLRASAGGILIPAAVIGAIAAFETARTTDASREVFFNISYPAIMYFVFAAFVAIVAGAFVQRLRIWRIGKGQGVGASFGARLTNMLTMGAFTSRVKTTATPASCTGASTPASWSSCSSPSSSPSTTTCRSSSA
jgi:hypothetical protein